MTIISEVKTFLTSSFFLGELKLRSSDLSRRDMTKPHEIGMSESCVSHCVSKTTVPRERCTFH